MSTSAEVPLCPVCTDTLGKFGGPVTLPCGHNGCLDCMMTVKTHKPQCPLCRAPFDSTTSYQVNHELKDLINLATSLYRLDEKSKKDGWEAFPTAKLTTEHYASEYKHARSPVFIMSDAIPTAPSLDFLSQSSMHGDQDILNAEPPRWLPDSYASHCGNCHLAFKPLARLRHHCRMCGKIFCNSCCHKRLLLPPKFASRDPQRACELCSSLLLPFQQYLAGVQSRAMQPPIHDATDSISLRSWVNPPWSNNMEDELYKAVNILTNFMMAKRVQPERSLPPALLSNAKGLAILSVLRVGAGWSASTGTGILLSRRDDGSWSAPCAVAAYGMGWGLQLGGELTDLLLVLHSDDAIKALCGSMTIGFGGQISAALGPLGRSAEATLLLGDGGRSTSCAYSCSKGAFVGISCEGCTLMVRSPVNLSFYGYSVSACQLLVERSIPQPPAASMLYDTLARVVSRYETRLYLPPPPPLQQLPAPHSRREAPMVYEVSTPDGGREDVQTVSAAAAPASASAPAVDLAAPVAGTSTERTSSSSGVRTVRKSSRKPPQTPLPT